MTSATVGAIDIVAWFVYLFSAVLFVVGLHFMNSPKTARKGNQISAFGMVVAVLMAFIVLFAKGFVNIVAVVVLVVGILIGAVAGVVSAKKVKMTDMPAAGLRVQYRGWWRRRTRGPERHPDQGRHPRTSWCSSPLVSVFSSVL